MVKYFGDIWDSIVTILTGMGITWRHMVNIKRDNVTLQYPEERWPRPDRDIGFEQESYNVIRSRLHVDIDFFSVKIFSTSTYFFLLIYNSLIQFL